MRSTVSLSRDNEESLLISTQNHPTIYSMTAWYGALMYVRMYEQLTSREASVGSRWSLSVVSTSASTFPFSAKYIDMSKHIELDLRCMVVLETPCKISASDFRKGPLVALGAYCMVANMQVLGNV